MAKLKIGDKAPAFDALDGEGKRHRLSDYKGKTVILYFYPRDMTPGCTTESCDFQTAWPKLKKSGVQILGVSGDSAASHQKFAAKHGLEFPLLVDADHEIMKDYGVWGDKVMYGRKFKGVIRSTFVISPAGKITRADYKVKVAGHVEDVVGGL